MAAEAGVFGAAAYLLLLAAVARQAVRAVRRARGLLWQGVAVGCAGISAALAVHNLFENLHVLNMGLQLGATWALLVAAERTYCADGSVAEPRFHRRNMIVDKEHTL